MALNFSKASTQFVRNLVELGVCESPDCLNAYHPPATVPGRSPGTSLRHSQLCSGFAPSTRPVIAIDVSLWLSALDSDDFPLTAICHRLSSSEQQMSVSLEWFIDDLFTAVSRRYGVRLETLVRALRLLERVQMTNIRAHNQRLLSQPSLRSGASSASCSYHSAAEGPVTWSQAPTVSPCPGPRGCASSLLHAAEVSVLPSALSPLTTMSMEQLTVAAPAPLREPRSAPLPCPPLRRRGSELSAPGYAGMEASSVSSGTVGPLTDAEQMSSGKGAAAARPSSLASWCLPTPPPSGLLSMAASGPAAAAVDLPSLLSRLQLCGACAGSGVFTLQYYNVHVLLAACLALSISINEVELMDALPEDVLMHEMADVSKCTDLALQVAVRVVCETLGGELCVFDSDVDALVHRLNIVETCVFATAGM